MKIVFNKTVTFLLSLGLLSVPFVFNSCQGSFIGSESGFSSAKFCKASEEGSLKPLSKSSSSHSPRLESPFQKQKVLLGQESLADVNTFSKGVARKPVVIPADQELVALVDVACLSQRRRRQGDLGLLSDVITRNKNLFLEIKQQAFNFVLDQNMRLEELNQEAEKDACLVGVSHQVRYEVASFNDPMSFYQAHLPKIKAVPAYKELFRSANAIATTGPTLATIAVIDTGVDLDHPDLKDVIWSDANGRGLDATTLEGVVSYNPTDISPDGHGTHVAGLLAAQTNNSLGIVGAIPHRAKIMAIRVFERDGDGNLTATTQTVSDALNWAVAKGADVINISLGRYAGKALDKPFASDDLIYRAALTNALNAGVFVVAAAGNGTNEVPAQQMDGSQFVVLPAKYSQEFQGMVTVGSFDAKTGEKSFFSHWSNKMIEIAAPGTEEGLHGIYSTIPRNVGTRFGYSRLAGTSMAAPQVSAAAGLIISRYKTTFDTKPSPAAIEKILLLSADKRRELAPYFKDGNRLNLESLIQLLHQNYPHKMEEFLGDSSSFSSELDCN